MFSHVALGADDIEAARRFYDAALGALGIPPGVVDEWGRLIYSHAGGRFLLTKPLNGAAASGANGGTLGFVAASTEAVDAWHAAGAANGGTAIEDPPGVRHGTEGRTLYLAYLRDPAGNKLCATHRLA
ncbi:Glyoxalase/bleomycin resistance protein/dioxygenase [Sphingopyxis sp. LC81]|uniref:VOC family protein n=1 Tax=Sphingopyxis sp. LC81 TaxID=1502850 RepID=UPI00051067A4|nr:VOC family protein [Sphingopyxis sp. LC81]KGB51840.1 Glyoxalase/bleomycin resistance protein/dioxygenase [Sphingopyxis sp. LC81]